MDPDSPGVFMQTGKEKIQDQHALAFELDKHITRQSGEVLGAWARGDAIEGPDTDLWRDARNAAHEGEARIKAFYGPLSEQEREALKPIKRELWSTAQRAQEALDGQPL